MAETEPTPVPPEPRRRRRRRGRSGKTRGRLRLVYFSTAAVWGFLAGSSATVVALALLGRQVTFEPLLVAALVIAAVLAVLGGVVAASAYRNAVRR